jgi:uncharacterized protein YggE
MATPFKIFLSLPLLYHRKQNISPSLHKMSLPYVIVVIKTNHQTLHNMKKLLTLVILFALVAPVFAQSTDQRRTIVVTGTAESEVTPDNITVSIALQEFMDGKKRVPIYELEAQLEKAVKDAGIPKEDFTIDDVSAWNNYYQKKRAPDFMAGKQYHILVHNLDKYNKILAAINPKGISATEVQSSEYSKIIELKRELKIKALLAARDKATYMLDALGEKLGRPITINETDPATNYFSSSVPQYSNTIMFNKAAPAESDINYKKIKISFQVQAVFEIK